MKSKRPRRTRAAARRIAAENLGLGGLAANRVWRAFGRFGVEYDDLVQEAALGLLRAARMYDPARAKLSTYLAACAIGAAMSYAQREKFRGLAVVSDERHRVSPPTFAPSTDDEGESLVDQQVPDRRCRGARPRAGRMGRSWSGA